MFVLFRTFVCEVVVLVRAASSPFQDALFTKSFLVRAVSSPFQDALFTKSFLVRATSSPFQDALSAGFGR